MVWCIASLTMQGHYLWTYGQKFPTKYCRMVISYQEVERWSLLAAGAVFLGSEDMSARLQQYCFRIVPESCADTYKRMGFIVNP